MKDIGKELNREKGAPPLYAQIEEILKKRIEEGEYQNGDSFPTETQLQELFSVSRITVRQAVKELEDEGYLQRARGVGTTVVFRKIDENLKQVISFSEEMRLHGIRMQTGLCRIRQVKPDRKVQRILEAEPGEKIHFLERVRCAGSLPIVYSKTWLKGVPGLSLDARDYQDSLYRLLDERYGVKIVRGTDMLDAVAADSAVAELLEVEPGAPLFLRSRRSFDQHGQLVEYSVCYYPGGRYQYTVNL